MSVIIVFGLMAGWLAVAAATFVIMDAVFGQPLLGKWWKRGGKR
jgi:hypothetical protein